MDGQDEGSRRIYITREISRRGGRQFGRCQEVLLVEYQKRRRRIHPRTRPEDGLWPFPQLRRWRSYSPRILPDHWWSPHKGPVLKPASIPNSLYWSCWVWVRSHLQWKTPPKSGPYMFKKRVLIGLNCFRPRLVEVKTGRMEKNEKKIWWKMKFSLI